MKTPQNIQELRNELLEAYTWIKADPKRHGQVKEMVNAAGKVIGTIKVQIEYGAIRGEKPKIAFMETE
jgi:hypothetical protein